MAIDKRELIKKYKEAIKVAKANGSLRAYVTGLNLTLQALETSDYEPCNFDVIYANCVLAYDDTIEKPHKKFIMTYGYDDGCLYDGEEPNFRMAVLRDKDLDEAQKQAERYIEALNKESKLVPFKVYTVLPYRELIEGKMIEHEDN